MYTKWLTLAWTNRAKLLNVARRVPPRSWMRLGGLAAFAVGVYLAVANMAPPTTWPPVQWVLVGINITGFVGLYLLMRTWFSRQDEVWDEVDQLRRQVGLELYEEEQPEQQIVERELGGHVFMFKQ